MKRVKLIATAVVLAVFAVWATGAAQDSNASERTFLTFSGSVEMPGVTLQAGTYVFKLADTPSRNVVQVWDRDEEQMVGHWLFVQAERPEVTEENVVMFKEAREGTTPAVQFWYYPGERIGKEFVYPRDQAQQIAARTGSDVLTADGDIDADARVSSIDAQGNVTEWQREEQSRASTSPDAAIEGSVARESDPSVSDASPFAQPTAPAGSLAGNRGLDRDDADADVDASAEVGIDARAGIDSDTTLAQDDSRAVGTSGRAQAEGQIARADTLPETASGLPLSGLLGLLSLAGAWRLRAARR